MKTEQSHGPMQAFENLRQFARRPRRDIEPCELCSAELYVDHPHLIELAQRKLLCACNACALLFDGQTGRRYKRVPTDVRLLSRFRLTDAEWEGLLIPINLAFFFENSLSERVSVFYPSPAGATESLLPLEAWTNIVAANPVLTHLQPDVEGLLVNRIGYARGAAPAEYYVVPIDACYKLAGLIRLHWRGLSGGSEVWRKIGDFFSELRAKAETVNEEAYA